MERILLTPGPTPLPETVRKAMARKMIHHRGADFAELLHNVTDGLRYVMGTSSDKVFIFTASGTGAMEAAVVNILSKGDKVIVVNTGNFGERWRQLCEVYGAEVVELKYGWGCQADVKGLEVALRENPDCKAVFAQNLETSTGVENDVRKMAKLTSQSEAIFVVDAISGLGCVEMKMDDWGIDVCIGSSQKGLMAPPGLSFIAFNDKAWERVENSNIPKFYWDTGKYREKIVNRQTPFTPAVSSFFALNESLEYIKKKTLKKILAKNEMLARGTRAAMEVLGLELLPKKPCDAITSIKVPKGVDGTALLKRIEETYNVKLAGGQSEYKGRLIRFAHMGDIGKEDTLKGLYALEKALQEDKNFKVKELGLATETAKKVFKSNEP